MTKRLQQARNDLEEATKSTDSDDIRDEIRETADAFADYALGETTPDHALLDERLNTLRQVRKQATGNTEATVESAIEAVEEYRESIYQD